MPRRRASARPAARPKAKGPGVAFWLDKLKQHHWRARYDATQALAKLGWKAMGKAAGRVEKALLLHLQKDKNFWVRQGAARAFGRLGHRGFKALAQVMVQDRQAEVRNEAAKALGVMARQRHEPPMGGHMVAVLAALRKARKDKAIRQTAAQTWEYLTGDPQPLVAVMLVDLRTRNNRIKGIVARSFGQLSTRAKDYAVGALLTSLTRKPAPPEAFVVAALTAIGKNAVAELRKATKDKRAVVQKAAAQALKQIQAAGP